MLDPAQARAPRVAPDVRLDTSLELLLDRELGTAPVLATVVATSGSTYRKHGARMLFRDDGSYLGLLSGGCLEGDLRVHADQVRASNRAGAFEYDTRGPDDALFGIGTGCEGAMRILLEPAGPGTPAARALAGVRDTLAQGRAATLVMVHESPRLAPGTYPATDPLPDLLQAAARAALGERVTRRIDSSLAGQRERILVQFVAPAPHLLVCGAGPDAHSVVAGARRLGWRVTVVDHRPAYVVPGRFPGARVQCAPARALRSHVDLPACHAAVIMSHHLESDLAYLQAFTADDAPGYVGLLGPAARRNRLIAALGTAATAVEARIRGPVGLDLGAATPEAIALAILGQIHAWLAHRDGRSMSPQNDKFAGFE